MIWVGRALPFLQRDQAFVVGDEDVSAVDAFAFAFIKPLAARHIAVLRVPEHQVGDAHGLRQLAGVLHRAVMLFVGLPDVPLRVKAEGLGKEPVGAPDVAFAFRLVGLVPQEGQLLSIIKDEAEAKKKNAPQTGNASTQTQIAQQPKKDQKLKQQTKDSKKTTSQDDDESDSEDEKEFVDESLIGSIKSAVQAVNDELKLSLNGILDNTDFTVSKRVLSTISSLVGSIHNTNVYEEGDDVLEKRNRLLLCTVGSLVKFIDTMINSEEIRSWALSKYSFEESQDLLTKQSQAISKFMNENCIEYMEDQDTILSAFVEQNDPLQLEKTVKAILSSMPSVKTNEGKDLLILLHQSLAAGLLLQAYASKVTNKWSEQGNEIETLHSCEPTLESVFLEMTGRELS